MAPILQHLFIAMFKYPPRVFQRGQLITIPVVPVAVLVVAIGVALVLTVVAMRRLHGVDTVDRIVLGGLRVAGFVVIAGCLMRPALALTSAVPQRNVLAILVDDSRSMRIRDADTLRRIDAVQRALADSTRLVRQLASRFTLRWFRFSGDAAPIDTPAALTATGARTDIGTSLASVRNELADVPLAGMVIVSDGADNGTSDLSAALLGLRSHGVPVYAVGVGRERFAHDVSIARLDVPATTLKGSGALVIATVGMAGAGGDSVTVTAEADGHIVVQQPVTLPRDRDALDVLLRLPPLDVGSHAITVRVSQIPGETVTENNAAEALLRVRPPFERVLYLEGQPRYEFSFLRRAFAGDSAVRLVGLLRSAKGKFLRLNVADSLDLLGGFPVRREDLFRYRALILGDIEASFFTGDQLRMIADFVDQRGGALIALGGRDALGEGGYAGTPIAEALPFTLETGGRRSTDTTVSTLKAVPTAAGLRHPALQLGPTAISNTARWDSLPTVTSVNRLGSARAGAVVLVAGQPVPRGDPQPLLAVQRYGRGIGIVLNAEDTWTWQMDPRAPLDNQSYQTFWRQLVRWSLDQVPDRVTISATPERVGPGDVVTLHAQVTDSIYMDVNDARVGADITTPTGASIDLPLDWTLHNDGSYAGQFVADVPGTYQFTVTATAGGDTTHSSAGGWIADPSGADMDHPERNTALLTRVANETGGKYYSIADLHQLPDDVLLTPSGIVAHETRDLWDMPIVLLVLIMLLGSEWGYRRWRGLA